MWKLGGNKADDSVLLVSRADYMSCNVSSPVEEHNGETVVVELERSGPYYFISGKQGACEKGAKVAVVVMAERRNRRRHYEFFAAGGHSPALAPAPAMAFEDGPALAPATGGAEGVLVGAGVVLGLVMGLVLCDTLDLLLLLDLFG